MNMLSVLADCAQCVTPINSQPYRLTAVGSGSEQAEPLEEFSDTGQIELTGTWAYILPFLDKRIDDGHQDFQVV